MTIKITSGAFSAGAVAAGKITPELITTMNSSSTFVKLFVTAGKTVLGQFLYCNKSPTHDATKAQHTNRPGLRLALHQFKPDHQGVRKQIVYF